ncbi:hypothetical protein Ppa06_03080 [Planomonospora parontospora subsp. parontospora]|uniref:Uncharacterized protein n=2 Tax=Planomonospora parontospora TaxID=58119 RepID=A0AA37BBR5_9ACTN|nr:hypothetical protein GCM10010126_03090 [Planomonospora parontospora]GII06510.1 hypothetical protein Ppa06_03080 [Planomonospora parontospora subsp. parontospora]
MRRVPPVARMARTVPAVLAVSGAVRAVRTGAVWAVLRVSGAVRAVRAAARSAWPARGM